MTQQYLNLCQRIVDEGKWITNERTGKRCLTVINADLEYDVGAGEFPLVTTRKSFYKSAIAEMIGYLRGYSNATDFERIGTKTWNANANAEVWQNNPFCKGKDDMGNVYGVVGRKYQDTKALSHYSVMFDKQEEHLLNLGYELVGDTDNLGIYHREIDQLKQVYEDLKQGKDNRFEMVTFYNPSEVEFGCLRPCMYSHHFSILDGTLYLNSTQRSADVPLGINFNMVQCYFLLAIMAQITGLKAGKVFHKIVNAHIYEDQLELMKEQLKREPYMLPTLHINPEIKTLRDVETWVTTDDFTLEGYQHHEPIKYPFSV